jgi:glycosyltransferase involved in cell wall biosynthesis
MLSFVIPAYNSARTIRGCVRSLLDQDLNGIEREIIVVDNGSIDSTCGLLENLPVRLVHENVPGAAAARNRGIAEAKGDLIALVDSDCELPRDWSRRAIDLLDHHKDACAVGGPGKMPPTNVLARCMNGLHYGIHTNASLRSVRSLATMDALYVGSILRKYPFDPECYWAEDAEMNSRIVEAGHRLIFDPRLEVTHHHPVTLGGILRKWYEYGIQYPVPYLKRRRLLFDPGLIPRLAYIPTLALLLIAGTIMPPVLFAALGVFLALPLTYLVLGWKAVRGKDRLIFPAIHTSKQWAQMIGMLAGLIRPSLRVRRSPVQAP